MSSIIGKVTEFVSEKIVNMRKPEADLTDVSVKSFNRSSITYHSLIDITNPYSHSIPICEIAFSFKSAGRLIVSGKLLDPGSIEGKSKTQVEIPMNVPYDFMLSILKDIGKDWDIDYEIEVSLIVDIPIFGNFTIPLNKSGELKLPTLSDIF